MNRIVKWLRNKLQVSDLENEFFRHEYEQYHSAKSALTKLSQVEGRVAKLEQRPVATRYVAQPNGLATRVDLLCAEVEELKSTLAKERCAQGKESNAAGTEESQG